MVRVVDERVVKNAILQRKSYIEENKSTLSVKALRALLEEDLKVPPHTLKPFKGLISERALQIVEYAGTAEENEQDQGSQEGSQDSDAENRPRQKKRKEKLTKQKGKSQAREDKPGKKVKPEARKEDKPRKRAKQLAANKPEKPKPEQSTSGKAHSKTLQQLIGICKRATIKIPPNVYRGDPDEAELQQRIEMLLDKHDLSAHAGEREVSRARARLQTARDLDGIDTSNIMQGGRRPRRAAALAVNYAQLEGSPGSDASDGDEEKEDDEDDDSGSDSDMADAASEGSEDDGTTKGAGPARKKRAAEPEDEHSSGSDSQGHAAQEAHDHAGKGSPAAKKRRTVLDDSEDEDSGGSEEQHKAGPAAHAAKALSASESEASEQAEAMQVDGTHQEALVQPVSTQQGQPAKSDRSPSKQTKGAQTAEDQQAEQYEMQGDMAADTATRPDTVVLQSHSSKAESHGHADPVVAPKKRRTVLESSSDDD